MSPSSVVIVIHRSDFHTLVRKVYCSQKKRNIGVYIVFFFQCNLMLYHNFWPELSFIVIFIRTLCTGSTRIQFKTAQYFFGFAISAKMGLRWRLMYNSENTSGHISQLLGFLGESLFYEWKIQSLLLLGSSAYYQML